MESRVSAVRAFNRFYTKRIGVLQAGLLGSEMSLTEVRVLYELARSKGVSASAIARELELDAGYLSRTLRRFERRRLISRTAVAGDARKQLVSLTPLGRKTFAPLDRRARAEVAKLLARLSAAEQERLLGAMGSIASLLDGQKDEKRGAWRLRAPVAGELGWVIARHGALYAAEYRWDASFEALVAEIVAGFAKAHDPARERCWIAELDGAPVGSVFLVQKSKTVAKLRLLLVEPSARGLGIGAALVAECVSFARAAGYKKLTLWTNDVLVEARKLYERAGFELVHEAPHRAFGHALVEQTWDRRL